MTDQLEDTLAHIEFLVRSTCRVQILKTLAEREGLEKAELKARVDGDRTTVQRNVTALLERGWVTKQEQLYRTTSAGRIILAALEPFVETVAATTAVEEFLEWVSPEEFTLDVRALREASVTVVSEGNPYAAVNQHMTAFEHATTGTLLLPEVGVQPMQASLAALSAGELTLECVVSQTVAEAVAADDQLRTTFTELLDTGNVTCRVTPERIPYYVGIFDHCVQIGVSDDEGIPRALVECENPAVREWAASKLDAYTESAVPFHPEGSNPRAE